ncbi:uncharacterized protein BO96DRAFT_405544 [Aspergillus niger CBS 101883]|uniref:uncharacterized protein n=1 Tax=Aspergillus lacticoffeatus (strain CBS 101883) TaxID=1450533 RepID=UPI000D7F7FA3|nr:uncharacterized protein BO96DRAFT_405544 [Aspergillus niger CBS 101883]PYH50722.1 hypothetical protein BO96DRAFT_405544 [Aspergillus niger CBS 101883]
MNADKKTTTSVLPSGPTPSQNASILRRIAPNGWTRQPPTLRSVHHTPSPRLVSRPRGYDDPQVDYMLRKSLWMIQNLYRSNPSNAEEKQSSRESMDRSV